VLLGISGQQSVAGPDVSPTSALSVPAVRASVDLVSGIIGTLPVSIYQTANGGGQEVAADQPGQFLVAQDANPWTSASELRWRVTADALLWGAGYAAVIRDGDGNPVELHRLLPWAVVASIDLVTGEPRYQYSVGQSQTVNYSFRDVIALTPIIRKDMVGSIGPLLGLAPIQSARNAIGLSQSLENHAGGLMRSGARPSGVLSSPLRHSADFAVRVIRRTAEELLRSCMHLHRGPPW
jgi:HK97 family phage portal protein